MIIKFFFRKSWLYEIMWKKWWRQKIHYDAERTQLLCRVNKAGIKTQAPAMFNAYCFLTATVATLTCPSFALYITTKVLFRFDWQWLSFPCDDMKAYKKYVLVQRKFFSHTTVDKLVIGLTSLPQRGDSLSEWLGKYYSLFSFVPHTSTPFAFLSTLSGSKIYGCLHEKKNCF
jgi:hypothetical protein